MTAPSLPAALRACAAGIYTHEAGVSLLIANRAFLSRDDFTSRFITHDTATAMAAIDWAAATAALDAGEIPCSGGEQRILRLAASIPRQPQRRHHRPRQQEPKPPAHRDTSRIRRKVTQNALTGQIASSEKVITCCSGTAITPVSRWPG